MNDDIHSYLINVAMLLQTICKELDLLNAICTEVVYQFVTRIGMLYQ